jgi:hypothetical protein
LVAESATAALLVPPDGSLGNAWLGASEPFDDSGWEPVTLGIGFDTNNDNSSPAALQVDFSRAPGSDPLQLDWLGFTHDGTAAHTVQFPTDDLAGAGNEVSVTLSGNTHWRDYAPATGSFAAQSSLLSDGPLCNVACTMQLTIDGLLPGQYRITTYHHTTQFGPSERVGNPFNVELTDALNTDLLIASDLMMSDNASSELSTVSVDAQTDGVPILLSFEKFGGSDHFALPGFRIERITPTVMTAVETDVEALMHGVNSSAYLRTDFSWNIADAVDRLFLDVAYNDGFVAYLNGVEVAARNEPGSVDWNSAASTSRTPLESVVDESIDISAHRNQLIDGQNILAIQGLNSAIDDADFLLAPKLTAVEIVDTQQQFFADGTPGDPNPEGIAGFVQDTKFGVDRGVFASVDEAFDVTITSDTAGATIVYTLDGSEPQWTALDTVVNGIRYSDALHISETTTLRAAAFLDGHQPSNVDTHSYIFLDDVVQQPADPAGFPSTWGSPGAFPGGQVVADYGLEDDPADLAGDLNLSLNEARDVVETSLASLPTLSLVLDVEDFFGTNGVGQIGRRIRVAL